MNIKDLKYYIHLADTLSFTKTAEKFQVSQPSISIALKRLEENFETTLIQRNRAVQNIQLTKAGEVLYATAIDILNILDLTKQKINLTKTNAVSIGLLPSMGSIYLPLFRDTFKAFADDIIFQEEASSKIMLDKVSKNQIPIAIIADSTPDLSEKSVQQYPISQYKLAAYVCSDHPWANKKKIKFQDFKNVAVISLTNDYVHGQVFEETLQKYDVIVEKLYRTYDLQTLETLTKTSLYVGIMSDLIYQDTDLIKLEIEDAHRIYTSIVVNQESTLTSAQKEFNEAIIDALNIYRQEAK